MCAPLDRSLRRTLTVLCCLAGAAAVTGAEEPTGVIVEEIASGFAADRSGLRPGDLLLEWRRAASPPANPDPAAGRLDSPFDLDEVELEQAPRGAVEFAGIRDEQPFSVVIPPGLWRLTARPQLSEGLLELYHEARRRSESEEGEERGRGVDRMAGAG